MAPLLADGDYVLLKRYGKSRSPRTGDVVCVARKGELTLIKRLGERLEDGRFRLTGDAASSAPSVDLGLVDVNALIGRAVISISGNRIRKIDLATLAHISNTM